LFLAGPATIKHFFLLNQTVLYVAAGEHVTKWAVNMKALLDLYQNKERATKSSLLGFDLTFDS